MARGCSHEAVPFDYGGVERAVMVAIQLPAQPVEIVVQQVLLPFADMPRHHHHLDDAALHQGNDRTRDAVEHSFAWTNRFRRLITRYERHADIHPAFTTRAASMICANRISKFW